MFYYISGKVAVKTSTFAVIDAGGVGYKLYASTRTLDAIGDCGSEAKLFTYTNFKASSDIFDLYGFATGDELDLFEMIIGVSRVGAKTAIALLSSIRSALSDVLAEIPMYAAVTAATAANAAIAPAPLILFISIITVLYFFIAFILPVYHCYYIYYPATDFIRKSELFLIIGL